MKVVKDVLNDANADAYMLEFVALIYTYELVVTTKVKLHRSEELYILFFGRMTEKKAFFKK